MDWALVGTFLSLLLALGEDTVTPAGLMGHLRQESWALGLACLIACPPQDGGWGVLLNILE